jgi:hypothetical protein
VIGRRSVLLGAPAVLLAGCGSAEPKLFSTLPAAIAAVQSLAADHKSAGRWSLAQVLDHAAQSVEYSMVGYPQLKSPVFRATVGTAAFGWFEARGEMTHGLDEAIPGAPPLRDELPAAIERLVAALRRFEAHSGPLQPHFAYGALDKPQYTRAHLMHLANHWSEVIRT